MFYTEGKRSDTGLLPLRNENWITSGNALRIDWLSVCPPTGETVQHRADDLFFEAKEEHQIDFENEGGETYICGTPLPRIKVLHKELMVEESNSVITNLGF